MSDAGLSTAPSTKLTVLISGSGTNLQAIIDATHTSSLPDAKIIRVISDRKNAYGLTRAHDANIPTALLGILPYKGQYPDPNPSNPTWEDARKAYDADLAKLVLNDEPELVVCAGFMRIVSPAFLEPLAEKGVRIINLHPSLHGDLVGAHCIERAWEEFVAGKRTRTGIMVHYVIAEVDMGEPIVQQEVDIEGCESLEDLKKRMQQTEHGLIVKGTNTVVRKIRGH